MSCGFGRFTAMIVSLFHYSQLHFVFGSRILYTEGGHVTLRFHGIRLRKTSLQRPHDVMTILKCLKSTVESSCTTLSVTAFKYNTLPFVRRSYRFLCFVHKFLQLRHQLWRCLCAIYKLNATADPLYSMSVASPNAMGGEVELSHKICFVIPPFPCSSSHQRTFKTLGLYG